MGMVVSAAVTGIPIIEELENARPSARKTAGGKPGAKKGSNTLSTNTNNQKQLKGKPKEIVLPGTKGGGSQHAKSINAKSSAASHTKVKGTAGATKREIKSVSDKSSTGKAAEKVVGKGGKEPNLPSKGTGKGRGRGQR
jgi:hypothetical protein